VVVLADDQAWGIVACSQRKQGPEAVIASRMMPVRYDRVAEGLGAVGIRAERPEEIGPAVQRALDAGCPALVHVPIAPLGPADVSPEASLLKAGGTVQQREQRRERAGVSRPSGSRPR